MRIYIVDDDAESKSSVYKQNFETIKRNLNLHGHSVTCEAYLEKAYNHLISHSNRFRYDLILVDHLFPNHFQSGRFVNSKSDIDNGTGAFLCGELSKRELFTPIILFTATGKDPDNIRKVLGDYGICYFFDKDEFNNSAVLKTTTLPGYKRIWTIRQYEIEKLLKVFFKNLSDKQLKAFEDEYNKGLTADWAKPELSIELEGGKYTALELLLDPFSIVNVKSVNKKIETFIVRSKRHYKFPKSKMDTEIVYSFLKNYLEDSNYESLLQEINVQALDYMLNVLYIRAIMEADEYDGSTDFELNPKNRKLMATNGCVSEARFYEKLILRRVALGFQSLVGFESLKKISTFSMESGTDNFFTKKTLAALMRHGTTNTLVKPNKSKQKNKEDQFPMFNQKEIRPTDIFGTGLGLNADESTGYFIMSDNSILKEELDWIQTFGNAAVEMREYFDILSSDSSLATTENRKLTFSDFTSLQNYLLNLKKKKTKSEFDEMIKSERENAMSELFEPVSLSLISELYNTL